MKIINSSYEIEPIDGIEMLKKIEKHGVKCYQMEHRIDEEAKSYLKFAKERIDDGHESVLEHEKVTVTVICDRGITHEIVRHRIGSYSQESTRYCNYTNKKFGNEITVVDISKHLQDKFGEEGAQAREAWLVAMRTCECAYCRMVNELGITPELARSVLPNSLKTEIVITYNLRQWRHFFKERAQNKRAHPQLREITIPMLKDFQKLIPVVFDDIKVEK